MAVERLRLEIDGEDFTGDCEDVRFSVPRLVYEEDNGRSAVKFLGPAGFQLTVINPSDRVRGLVDGGAVTRTVKLSASGSSITHSTHFHKEWTTTDGVCKVFGSLAWDQAQDAEWVDEPQLAKA